MRYREAIDEIGPQLPLILISPVKYAEPQHAVLPSRVYPTDWKSVAEHIQGTDDDKSIDQDLRRTLARWCALQTLVKDAVDDQSTEVSALSDLVEWLGGESSQATPNAPPEYQRLAGLLVVSALAEAMVDLNGRPLWRRCNAAYGAHGDVQADVCRIGAGYYPSEGYPECGLAVVVRFHADAALTYLDVCVGTVISPYRQGQERLSWVANRARWRDVQSHATKIRSAIQSALRLASMPPIGNPGSDRWWSRSFVQRFSGADRLQDLLGCAAQLGRAIGELGGR